MAIDAGGDDALREALASAQAEGDFLGQFGDAMNNLLSREWNALFDLVVRMHASGEIDAVGALLNPEVERDRSPDQLARQQIVGAIVSTLAAPVGRMTAAIDAVAGRTVQHVLDDAFLAWCKADASRADEVIASFNGGMGVANRYVLAALIAGLRTRLERYLRITVAACTYLRPGATLSA